MEYKLTLGTDKIVVIRDMQIGDQELAAESAGLTQTMNPIVAMMKTQLELLKLLLISVDGQPLTAIAKENLKTLFSVAEYNQITSFIGELNGGDLAKPLVETLTA